MRVLNTLFHTALLSLAATGSAMAGEFPERPVTLVVPYAAGGGPDVQARQFAPKLEAALGASVIVENKVGAAGVVAAQSVKRAPADGYTILLATTSTLVQKHLRPDALYDPIADFSGVSEMARSPNVLVVSKESKVHSLEDLMAAIKAAPGELNYSSGGVGTAAHIAAASFLKLDKLDATHIPLRGSVEIAASIIRGDTAFSFPIAGTAIPMVAGDRFRALAVTGENRLKSLPDLPTLYEKTKEPLLIQEAWFGLWVPKGTPKEVIDKLHKATVTALQDTDLQASFEAGGSTAVSSTSPEDFDAFIKTENEKWRELAAMASSN